MSRLYLTHMGIINSLGVDVESICKTLNTPQVKSPLKPQAGLLPDGDMVVGAVDAPLASLKSDTPIAANSRNNRLLQTALDQIHKPILDLIERFGSDRIAVIMASSTSGVSETEKAFKHRQEHHEYPDHYDYGQQEMDSAAQYIAHLYGLNNLCMTVSTACSSSAKAFANARDLIEAGIADAAIVGGVDTLCQLTAQGFHSLEAISPEVCNPFSKNRRGTSLGEAATVFILSSKEAESDSHDESLNNNASIVMTGVGESVDGYHMSSPCPDGSGAELAIQAALDDAGLNPQDIDYINLHGTATQKNDAMEAPLIQRLFGADIPCSSTKPLTGHTLGAAGITEMGLCWLLLKGKLSQYPPHLWDGEADPNIPLLNFTTPSSTPLETTPLKVMSNSFAFGGSNVSVVLERETRSTTVEREKT